MSELNLNPDTDIGVDGIEHNHYKHDAQLIASGAPVAPWRRLRTAPCLSCSQQLPR